MPANARAAADEPADAADVKAAAAADAAEAAVDCVLAGEDRFATFWYG